MFCKGITKLRNCATEPEVKDLIIFLKKSGCKINWIGSRGLDVTGVDISKYSIDIAEKFKKKNKNKLKKGKLKYIALNFNEFDFSEKYDTIIFFRSLHHFPNIKHGSDNFR